MREHRQCGVIGSEGAWVGRWAELSWARRQKYWKPMQKRVLLLTFVGATYGCVVFMLLSSGIFYRKDMLPLENKQYKNCIVVFCFLRVLFFVLKSMGPLQTSIDQYVAVTPFHVCFIFKGCCRCDKQLVFV